MKILFFENVFYKIKKKETKKIKKKIPIHLDLLFSFAICFDILFAFEYIYILLTIRQQSTVSCYC